MIAALSMVAAGTAMGADYEVTVTNLTRGQQFTPILVASHKPGVTLFELGASASPELATLAEEGNVGPLTAMLTAMSDVREVVNSGGLLAPGASVTQTVRTDGKFDHVSLAAMLIPTNDAFFAINDIEGPKGKDTLTVYAPAYDSGSERNDETCASIPGPAVECPGGAGMGGAPAGGEEGYVHIHAGIHGIGDIDASMRDWRNPVARITIRRVK
jgi:hypothetical protein